MPLKGSGHIREADFRYNEDRTKVQCRVCAFGVPVERQTWIEVKSAARHLTSGPHLLAVGLAEDRANRLENLQKEREANSATTELRDIQIALPQFDGPVASAVNVMSEAEAKMWADYAENGADFSTGFDFEDTDARHRKLRQEGESFGLWNPNAMARKLGFGPEDEEVGPLRAAEDDEDDFLADVMRNIDLGEPETEEIQGGSKADASSEWFPYPSKIMFLLDTLDNLPRLRISSSLMRVFLWVLKEAKCKDVPSFDCLRRVQKGIRAQCGIPTIPCKSVQGNVFFMNDPTAIIAKDWSNPTTRKLIHVYPEIPEDGVIREIWHGQKWRKDMDLDILSPMYDAGVSHYYVNEVSRLRNDTFVIPIRWVKFKGKLYADAFCVSFNEQGEAMILDTETSLIFSGDLIQNYYDLEQAGDIPKWAASTIEAGHPARMPNPKRIIAKGRPMYCSFVNYFGDDVSGNRSKSWNKHWNAYMTHMNLPRQLLQQEFHIHFVSTSPNASVSEQFHEFKAALEATHTEPIEVRDAESGSATCLCIHANAGPSDNPMQSEVSGHIGGKGNCPCRKCKMGGTQQEKTTNEGYHAIFEAGEPRTKEHILEELEKQVKLACSGVVTHVKDSQTETGVKDIYTQYWIDKLILRFKEMKKDEPYRSVEDIRAELIQWTVDSRDQIYDCLAFDPARDTPVEILHTILLGVIKYIWHITHTPWSAEEKKTYAMRLQSTNTDGLSIHAIRSSYIMQYAGSLIGRQFKTLAQTSLFHVHGLVSDDKFRAWKAAGELSVLLWFPEIRNLAEYRIKYHLLVHTDDDVVQFGPLIGVITEGFESFNGVFRYCSILSNHLAPSRDIAKQLADQEGGWWASGADEWEQAGPGVRHFMGEHPVLQKLVGWTEKKVIKHAKPFDTGEIKLTPLKRGQKERQNLLLKSTSAAHALNYGLYSPESTWSKCVYVISESLDECLVGSWVFAKTQTNKVCPPTARSDASSRKFQDAPRSGRISDILVDPTSGVVLVVLELFQVLSSRDKVYGMPVLNIQFKFNVQHDCSSAKCEASGVRLRMQERVKSDQTDNYIIHKSLDRFLSTPMHFIMLISCDLLAPIPLFSDRRAKHDELATQLRENIATRKAAAADKKRKRSKEDEGEHGGKKPRKKKKTATRRQARRMDPPADSMVANRPKRTITQSERAKAAELGSDSEDSSEAEDSLSEDMDEEYNGSDGNYSD
ncbi:hypothetical protein FB451DRAFT_1186723 [Mycena latifolia]|nr:hypothetical protein FB451DRAFT_1186723 [Mycena latifolia]